MSKEMLGAQLNAIHNIHFLLELMRDIRRAIQEGTFAELGEAFLGRYRVANAQARVENRQTWGKRKRNQTKQ